MKSIEILFKKNYIFYDYRTYTIFEDKKTIATIETDLNNSINTIKLKEKKSKKDRELVHLLMKTINFHMSFFNEVKFVAEKCEKQKNEELKKDYENFTIENALLSILSDFNLNDAQKKYFLKGLFTKNFKNKKRDYLHLTDSFLKMVVGTYGLKTILITIFPLIFILQNFIQHRSIFY